MNKHTLFFITFCWLYASCTFASKESNNSTNPLNVPEAIQNSEMNHFSKIDCLYSPDSLYSFTLYKIKDSVLFNRLYDKFKTHEPVPFRVTDIDSIRTLIKGKVEMEKNEYDIILVHSFKALNGKEKVFLPYTEEGLLLAYYPEYNFLLMEGGHSSDEGYDLTTGESIYEAGNPATQMFSPQRLYRISGIYGGQECSTYIIQIANQGERLHKMGNIFSETSNVCNIHRYFWENDHVFYFSEKVYGIGYEEGKEKYYKLIIKKRE